MNQNKIINGKKLADLHQQKLVEKLESIEEKPRIISILIGDDQVSLKHAEIKQKKARELGIDFKPSHFPKDVNFINTLQLIKALNRTPGVDGVMIQLPLPKEFLKMHQPQELLNVIDPVKDIDGLSGKGLYLPAIVKAVLSILEDEKIDVSGKQIVVVETSDLVGKPLAQELKKKGGEVISCNTQTEDLKKETMKADVLILTTEIPGITKEDMVKVGAVAIEVKEAEPMVVISLMENVVECVIRRNINNGING